MNAFVPLLAAVNPDVLVKIVMLFLIFVVPAIGRVLVTIRKTQPPPAVRPRPPRPVAPNVADEIEEFMRRAAERRKVQGTQPAPVPTPTPTPTLAEPLRSEVVAEPPVGGQMEEHVKTYLDAKDFTRRSQELGEEVAQVDRDIGEHLHEVFDHQVSKLEIAPGEAAAAAEGAEPAELAEASSAGVVAPPSTNSLLDLVNNPESLCQAIILNEILHRPEERWV
jgi:hypothetical protein